MVALEEPCPKRRTVLFRSAHEAGVLHMMYLLLLLLKTWRHACVYPHIYIYVYVDVYIYMFMHFGIAHEVCRGILGCALGTVQG